MMCMYFYVNCNR